MSERKLEDWHAEFMRADGYNEQYEVLGNLAHWCYQEGRRDGSADQRQRDAEIARKMRGLRGMVVDPGEAIATAIEGDGE